MTTIYLIYSTLKHILDLQTTGFTNTSKHTIRLIKRINKIKPILSECCMLPSVIDNIICKYNDEIIEYTVDSFTCNHGVNYFDLGIGLHNTTYISININLVHFIETNTTLYYIYVCAIPLDVVTMNDSVILRFEHFNAFMEKVYKKKKYINCKTEINKNIKYVMQNSAITRIHSKKGEKINTVCIKNYRKFTYLIVELKCIVSGLQRYFKTTDINKHCEMPDIITLF